MTTTIVPATGSGVLVTQQGTGTAPGYAALDVRRATSGRLQAGVLGTTTTITAGGVANTPAADFMVTQRGAGANMSVDVNMPAGGVAYVQGGTISGQGLYVVPCHSVTINEVIAGADPSSPRVDQVILEVQDNVLDASGGNLARTRVLTGTPTAGATLANRSGAAALPASALLLADVLVPASSTSVPNTNVRDRRRWARGANLQIVRTGGNYTTVNNSLAMVDSVNLNPRVECSGVPLRVTLQSSLTPGSTGATLDLAIDNLDSGRLIQYSATSNAMGICLSWVTAVAGSHLIGPMWLVGSGGTATLSADNAGHPLEFEIEEIVKQNAANNTVTSG